MTGKKKKKKAWVRVPCLSLYFPFSLSFSITAFPQEQTWDWLCIGVSPASICLTSGPAFLYPHEREQQIKKRGGMEKGARERKREVCPCPKGLVSVCLNQEVRMWWQERQSRDVPSVSVCVCVFVCLLVYVCVCMDLVELRCHICEDHSFTLVATRDDALNHWNARNDWCCDMLCVCVCVNVCLLGHLMEIKTTFRVWKWKCYQVCPLEKKESDIVSSRSRHTYTYTHCQDYASCTASAAYAHTQTHLTTLRTLSFSL